MECTSTVQSRQQISQPIPIRYSKTSLLDSQCYNNTYNNVTYSRPIPIPKTDNNMNTNRVEYSLKQNFFDPTKNSPPDNFMEKLEIRMQHYYNNVAYSNDDKRSIAYFTK